MKFLVLLLVALFGVWLWRSRQKLEDGGGQPPADARRAPQRGIASPQPMVRCAVCGLHLPRHDALAGTQSRFYCSRAHRDQTEAPSAPSRASAPTPPH